MQINKAPQATIKVEIKGLASAASNALVGGLGTEGSELLVLIVPGKLHFKEKEYLELCR